MLTFTILKVQKKEDGFAFEKAITYLPSSELRNSLEKHLFLRIQEIQ